MNIATATIVITLPNVSFRDPKIGPAGIGFTRRVTASEAKQLEKAMRTPEGKAMRLNVSWDNLD